MDKNNIPEQKNNNHLKAVKEEQDQVKELLRRGTVRHYFLGPENMWTQEGFGIVVGGLLAVLFGALIFPKLFLYSTASISYKYVCWVMTAIGIVLIGKGLYGMLKESRRERKPVPDEVHDEILRYDIEGLKNESKTLLKTNVPKLAQEENIDSMEMVLVKGPRDYVNNVNLPLQWKLGSDGRIRYSNFSVMALYFGEENLYIYTCIFNMRNASAKYPHTYECPYREIQFVGFQDRVVDTVNQKNKAVKQNLQFFVINTGSGEKDELAIPVQDYDILKTLNGTFDISDAELAKELIEQKIKGVK